MAVWIDWIAFFICVRVCIEPILQDLDGYRKLIDVAYDEMGFLSSKQNPIQSLFPYSNNGLSQSDTIRNDDHRTWSMSQLLGQSIL